MQLFRQYDASQANFAGPMGFGILFASMFMGVIAVLAGLYFVTKPRSSERAAIYWSVIATVTLCFAASLVEWTAFFRYYVVKAPIHDWDPGVCRHFRYSKGCCSSDLFYFLECSFYCKSLVLHEN